MNATVGARVRVGLVCVVCGWHLASITAVDGGVREDLVTLRNRCLYYAAGTAPNSPATTVLSHGLYMQSPWPSPANQIDLAASGFALAALPAATAAGLIGTNAAFSIATNASAAALGLFRKSAAASTQTERGRYGYQGMLYHYYVWSDADAEFRADPASEVSSADTVWLLYGMLASGRFFGGRALADFEAARTNVGWRAWLDAGNDQFYMEYWTNTGLRGHWNWRSDETTAIILMAASGDTNLNPRTLWSAWTRQPVAYTSPPPSAVFACYASWNGDPFTDFYGLHFWDTRRMPPDFAGVDWFANNRQSYLGHVEYFAKERGFLDAMSFAFVAGAVNPIAHPKSNSDPPYVTDEGAIYSLAGGLPFYDADPASNLVAKTLSALVAGGSGFFEWHGWPAETVVATQSAHAKRNVNIVGQDICSIALSIENYLNHRIQDLVVRDEPLRRAMNAVFPPRAAGISGLASNAAAIDWDLVPLTTGTVYTVEDLRGVWHSTSAVAADTEGHARSQVPAAEAHRFFRLETP